jgi:glycosyltransferase involved in cell wall biosynthesis
MPDVSIVIPTKNRMNNLEELLNSILGQTVLPKEVIIVDDSDDDKTQDLVEQMRRDFLNKNIEIKYIRGGGQGLAQARNIGAAHSTGEIYCGFDDDVIIDKDYIKEILNIYEEHPNALGVQGYVTSRRVKSASEYVVNKLCSGYYAERNKCKVLPLGMIYPHPLTGVIECEWLSGTNSSYRRNILRSFKWDENLKRYSLWEDVDISYRIHKCYPGSLYITPYAKIIHKHSLIGRMKSKDLVYMEVLYSAYFFLKNIKKTLSNIIIFIWGIFFGSLIFKLFEGRRIRKNPNEIIFLISAYVYLLKHFKELKKGKLSQPWVYRMKS